MAQIEPTVFEKLKEARRPGGEVNNRKLRYSFRLKLVILLISIILCSIFFALHIQSYISEVPEYSMSPGYIWRSATIKADYSFPVLKSEYSYSKEVDEAIKLTPPVFMLIANALNITGKRFDAIIDIVLTPGDEIAQRREPVNNPEGVPSQKALTPLISLPINQKVSEINKIRNETIKYFERAYKKGILNVPANSFDSDIITLRVSASEEVLYQKSNTDDSIRAIDKAREYLSAKFQKAYKQFIIEFIPHIIISNVIFSEELTSRAKVMAEKSVPRTSGIVRAGDIIIEKGSRVTSEHIQKLQSYEKTKLVSQKYIYSFWNTLGSIGHLLLIYLILLLYLFFIRKRIWGDNLQFGIINSILVLVAFQSWLTVQMPGSFPIEYLMLIPAFSMLAAIVFDSRTAFYTTVTMALLLAGIRSNDYETSTTMLLAGTLAAYSVRDIQSRSQMYQSILFILVGFFIAIGAFALERSLELSIVLYRTLFAGLNSIISPLLTFGLIFLLDRFTDLTTDLRIKEFDNLSHPLMVELSEMAPGTYQHTITVASLTERCARAINANPLLVKVGAYFHDIGKIDKPEYFVENYLDKESKHDLIPPKKSADIIREHVLDGIEMAKKYKLPQRLIDFIPMHHGTTLIKHFFAKAKEASGNEPLDEEDFRYPGPKPKSKETAILMLCDPAEALSRLYANDDAGMEKALSKIIEERILDGQLDECDINLKEIDIIKETCLKSLIGIIHKRIQYKEIPKDNK